MAKAYSKEFRREVLSACDEGLGTREAAVRFDVSESWVRRIKQDRREQGKTAPLTTRKRIPEWAVYSDQILEIFSARPDTTLKELKAELGTDLSTKTLCIACQKLKLTFKKKSWSRRNKNAAMSK
jgi:transposase